MAMLDLGRRIMVKMETKAKASVRKIGPLTRAGLTVSWFSHSMNIAFLSSVNDSIWK